MAVTFINNKAAYAGASTATTAAVDMTGATFLCVIAVGFYDGSNTVSVSSSPANTWSSYPALQSGGDNVQIQIFYVLNPTVSSTQTFTTTVSASRLNAGVMAFGFAGVATSSADDGHVTHGAGGTTNLPGSITPTVANDLFITGCVSGLTTGDSAIAINSSYNITDSTLGGTSIFAEGAAYLISTDALAKNPTWTFTGNGGTGLYGVHAAFKAAVASSNHFLSIMGVGG